MRIKGIIAVLLIVLIFSVFTACDLMYTNIFQPFAGGINEDPYSIKNYDLLIKKAEYFMKVGDYNTAYMYYDAALKLKPKSSVALEGKLSALFFKTFSVDFLTNQIDKFQTVSSEDPATYISNYHDLLTNTAVYSTAKEIKGGLQLIISSNMDGEIPPNDPTVNLNFSVLNSVYYILFFMDSSEDIVINSNDVVYRILEVSAASNSLVIPPDLLDDVILNAERYSEHFSNSVNGFSLGIAAVSNILVDYPSSEILKQLVPSLITIKTGTLQVWQQQFEDNLQEVKDRLNMIADYVGATNINSVSEVTQLITNILDVWNDIVVLTNKINTTNDITNYLECTTNTNTGEVVCWITNTNA